MNELETALRAKYRSPKEVVRALGLDAAILREPGETPKARAVKAGVQAMLAEDSLDPNDLIEFLIDHIKADKARTAEAEGKDDTDVDEEEEREDDDLQRLEHEEDDNDGEAGEEEDDMEANSGLPVNAGEREEKKEARDGEGGKIAALTELFKRGLAILEGREEEHEEHAIDEEIDGKDCAAKDEDLEERKEAKDEEAKDLKEEKKEFPKPAMDAKTVKKLVKIAVDAAVAENTARLDAKQSARDFVQRRDGKLAIVCDSAEEYYKHGLVLAGVNVDGLHPSTYKAMLEALPLPGSTAPRPERRLAQDAAAAKDTLIRFPHADRLKRA